jgi:23S rRNA (guanosine2251-2'-O)-methyltransferase
MIIYGKNVARDTIMDNDIKRCYMYKNFNDKDIIKMLNDKNTKIIYKDKRGLDELTKYGNHQGIALEVEDYEYKDMDVIKDGIVVMLDHITDPHNLGAIIRTCEAAGVKNIIIPKNRSVMVTGTVSKVSAGTLNKVNIIPVTNLVNTINKLKKDGFWVVGSDMEGTDYYDIDYSGKIVIVIGSEGKGMTRLVRENCDFIASIPMNGTVNSLNASVSLGIILFRAVR